MGFGKMSTFIDLISTQSRKDSEGFSSGSDTILATLPANTGVYVEGQNYLDSVAWHKVTYQGTAGYIREDYLRMMTSDEVTAFLTTPSPSPSPSLSPSPSVSPSVSPSDTGSPWSRFR